MGERLYAFTFRHTFVCFVTFPFPSEHAIQPPSQERNHEDLPEVDFDSRCRLSAGQGGVACDQGSPAAALQLADLVYPWRVLTGSWLARVAVSRESTLPPDSGSIG